MKKILRNALFAVLSFLALAYVYPGFKFENPKAMVFTAVVFSFFYLFVRPILKIFSLPFNLITFGVFSLFINLILLYLILNVVPGFKIIPFQFAGVSLFGFSVPPVYLNSFMSALAASISLSALTSVFFWIFS